MSSDAIQVGKPAPEFKLSGSVPNLALSQFKGESAVVIFFMRDFGCHTCVGHVLNLAKAHPQIQALYAQVLVIGGGSAAAANRLAEKYKLPFPILADTDHKVYDRFGLEKVLLYWQRSGVFIIDREGVASYINEATSPSASFDLSRILLELTALAPVPAAAHPNR